MSIQKQRTFRKYLRRSRETQSRQRRLFVEQLEDRRLLAVLCTYTPLDKTLTCNGDGDNDLLILQATGTVDEVEYNAGLGSLTQADVERVIYNGNDGADRLLISNPGNDIFAPINGIQYNGGAGDDDLVTAGGNALTFTGSYTSTGTNTGTLTYTTGANTETITFDSIVRIDEGMTTSTFVNNIDGAPDEINVVDGPLLVPVASFSQGPVYIDGGDRDDHGGFSGGNQDGWKFIEQVLDFVHSDTFNGAPNDVLSIGATGSSARDAIDSAAAVLGLGITHETDPTAIQTSIDFNQYKVLYIPSNDDNTGGGISAANLTALATRKDDIADFVRNGGGVMALTEEGDGGLAYAWLEIPDLFTTAASFQTIQNQTTFLADAFDAAGLQITNLQLSNGTPTHNRFTGPVGFNGLDPWVVFPGGPGQLVDAANGGEYSPNPTDPTGATVFDPTPGDDHIIALGQGAIMETIGGGQSLQVNDNGTNSFVTINLTNNTNVQVKAGGDNDDIHVEHTTAARAAGLALLDIFGEDGNDDIEVFATPDMVVTTINGGANNDTIDVGNAANSLDQIDGDMIIDGGTGATNVLTLNDQGDAGNKTYDVEDLQIVREDPADTPNTTTTYSYDNLSRLVLNTGSDDDLIHVDFGGSNSAGLTTVEINGGTGEDEFHIESDSAPGAVTTLNGNAGEDDFIYDSGEFQLRGFIDGGSENDRIDYDAYDSLRRISLTSLGTTDGFAGDDISSPDDSLTVGFDNIDILIGTAFKDFLRMDADLRTHWDLGGDVSGYGLTPSLIDTGVLIADESDLSLTGNATQIGRPEAGPPGPAQPNPIAPNAAGEADLAWTSFENLVGAATKDDRFDFRHDGTSGAVVTCSIDGRGSDGQGDSLDYRDFPATAPIVVNLGSPDQSFRTATNVGEIISGAGSDPGNSIENVFGGNGSDQITGDEDNNILGDGHGSDTLDGGAVVVLGSTVSGNDTFRLEPGMNEDGTEGSSDVLTDLNGNDTVDFRFADGRVMVDMDLLDTPQDVLFGIPGSQFVTLMRRAEHDPLSPSMFENVVGSQFNDIIDLDPLTIDGNSPQGGPPTLRNVDGNDPYIGGPDDGNAPDPGEPIPPGDEWHLNAAGQSTLDTGFSISVPGLGSVTYQSIETFKAFNTVPRIIDDGDDDFTESPTDAQGNISFYANWNLVADPAGLKGDFRYNHADTESGEVGGDHTATWNFFGVTPGMYRVSVSFPDPAVSPALNDVASDAEYTIRDDGRIIARIDVDQRTGASDFQDQGVWWDDLGIFDIRSHSLLVRLRDRADGMVLADAVRIERVNVIPEGAGSLVAPSTGGEITVLDGSQMILDDSSRVDMVTNITGAVAKTFVIRNDGDGPLRIDDIVLDPLDVSGPNSDNYTLVKPVGLSPATPLTLAPGASTFFTLTLDAETANAQGDFPAQIRIFSNDFDENVVQKPGTTGISDPTDLVNMPPNDVDPFTFDIRGVVTDDWIVDDGDPEFSLVGTWNPASGATGFQDDELTAPGDNTGDRAIWTFDGLPDGWYRVSATWEGTTDALASTQSPFTVADINGILNSVALDQTVAPNDFTAAGTTWEDLGPAINLTGGKIVVNLLDTASQASRYVLADAVRIERLYSNANTTPAFVTSAPDIEVEVDMTDVADDTGLVDFGATWPGGPITKTFTIRNVGGANLTVAQPVSLPAGFTLISFDGMMPPDAVTSATIAPGGMMDIVVRMEAGLPGSPGGEIAFATNDPDENTFNFQASGTIRSSQLIDDQDGAPGYMNTGGFQLFTNNNQGFQGRVHFASGDNTGDSATWTFNGVTPGRQYLVSVSWTADPNRATDAPFSVAGVTAPATIDVNQQLAPGDLRANGHLFGDLGIFTADGTGTLTVTLSDDANGVVIADVVRIAAVEQPEIEVVQGGTVLIDGQNTIDFGSTLVGTPVDRAFTINNVGSRALALGAPTLPPGFSLPGGFPSSIAAGGSAGFTVRFNAAAAGEAGGVLRFTSDELDENPFEINLNADAFTVSTQIIDDGGAGFMSGMPPFVTMGGGGFMGDFQQAAVSPVATAGMAKWTFAVTPMTQYRVSATWVAAPDRATNATFSLGGVMTGPTSSVENQRVAPNDFTDAGTAWEDLAIITTDGSGTLTVMLPNDTVGLNGLVIADAVRIEKLLIINNEDPAPHYGSTGDFFTFGSQGRRGTIQAAADNAPASTATFTFSNLAPGSTYRVSATWSTDPNRATDAPFTVSGVTGGPKTVAINQEVAPNDYTAENSSWEDLGGPYTVDGGGTITVTLTNLGANQYVVADAIRLQPLAPQPEILVEDSGMNDVPDGGTFSFGATPVGTPVVEIFTITNHGSAPLTLDGALLTALLDQAPQFELVSGFSLNPVPVGLTSTFSVRMLADAAGSPSATIVLGNNDTDENPYEITLTGDVIVPSLLIDDGDAGYSESGPTVPLPLFAGQGFMNDVRQISPGSGNTASYSFTGLTMGATYEVALSWTAAANRSTAAPLTVMGALGGDVEFAINQQVAPGDFTNGSTQFDVIGLFRTTGTTLTVVWDAAATGFVIADAVQVVEVLAPGPEIQVTGSPNVADGGTFNLGTTAQGGTLSKVFTITNQGGSPLSLAGSITLPAGFTLGAVAPAGLFGGGPTVIPADGAAATFEILVNTATTGMKSGQVEFGNNDADESPFQINLTANVVSATTIIDDGNAGYSDTGFGAWGGQGFMNDVHESTVGAGKTATWTFNGLDPLGVYQVATTWTAFSNRASNAPYTVTGAAATMVAVNQKVPPSSFSASGVNWQTLTTLSPTAGGLITVTLTDVGANGNVIADAVRLERLFGPEIDVSQGSTPIIDGATNFDFGQGLIGSVFRKTFTIDNVGAAPLSISPNLTLPAGFTLVTVGVDAPTPATLFDGSLINTMIAAGATGTFTVEVNTALAGSFSGGLSFGNNDANEAPFNFTLEADVVASLIIDDGQTGFSSTAGFGTFGGQGFMNDVRAEFSPNGGDTATWTFTGLSAGLYRVSATWSQFSNRATNAPFSIASTTGGGMAGPIAVNQKLSPADPFAVPGVGTSVADSGATFADLLAMYNHTGGDLVITLSDTAANGWIIADAIRIAAPGMLQVEPFVGQPSSAILTGGQLQPLLDQAVGYWSARDASAAARLQNVQVIVTDLPGHVLGLGSFASPTIWLDDNGAGYGWQMSSAAQETFGRAAGADLLSVITHELGHVLGLPDLDVLSHQDEVMAGVLPVGLRRVPDSGSASPYGSASPNGSAGLLAPSGLTPAAYRSAADRLFDQYALRDGLLDLTGDRDSGLRRAADDGLLPAGKTGSALASGQRPLADDRLLSRKSPGRSQGHGSQGHGSQGDGSLRLDRPDDVLDGFFAELGDERVDQKEASELLDE